MKKTFPVTHTALHVLAATAVCAALLAGTPALAEATAETAETAATELSSEAVIQAERADRAEQILRETIENYSLTIHFPDGSIRTITAAQMGLSYNPEDSSRTLPGFSEEALKDAFLALPEATDAASVSSANAHMELTEDDRFVVVPETYGTTLNLESVLSKLYTAAANWQDTLILSDEDYLQPEILADDIDLNASVRKLNDFLSTTVTETLYSGREAVLGTKDLISWISQSEEDPGTWYIDSETVRQKAASWVEFLAAMDDQTEDTLTFHSTKQGDVELKVSDFGHIIDQSAETDAIVNMVLSNESGSRTPVYKVNETDPSLEDTYVEVDRENQHLWLYKHGVVVMDTDVVTGTDTDSGRRTPAGAFRVYLHQKDRVLTGPGYASPVHYWMPFNGGVGFHDADWRSEFGGDIYIYSGSHGCINMPCDMAGYLYDRISTGTRVFVI